MDVDTSGGVPPAFDPSKPLKGIVVCCTSIPPNETKDIEQKTTNLGGVFTGDLTVEVTHLLVGDYDTAKYRHAAKSLAHVKAMDAGWIEALTDLWREDAPIDFAALEKEWRLLPLETGGAEASSFDEEVPPRRKRLMVCLTGFLNLEERTSLQEKITSNGAQYSGELNRKCTHLIAAKPEGQKYLAARKWGLKVVSLEWLNQTIERGMVLDEKYYDPLLPPEERGKGARDDPDVALGKRQRLVNSFVEPDGPRRKLRKTASMKLSSQRETVWGDILGGSGAKDAVVEQAPPAREQTNDDVDMASAAGGAPVAVLPRLKPDAGIFSTSFFYIHGFDTRKFDIVNQTITALGGRVCRTLDEVCLARAPEHPWHRFLVIPQDSPSIPPELSPTSLPSSETTAAPQIVTEFFLERCIHSKTLLDPQSHVLGRPFPKFPIRGFDDLTVCSAGFSGIDLHHLDRAVQQLGAQFDETFRRRSSLLICKDLKLVRKEKLRLALEHGIPVVGEKWLWECTARGERVPLGAYMFPELGQRDPEKGKKVEETHEKKKKQPTQRTKSEPPAKAATIAGFAADSEAFREEEGGGDTPGEGKKSFATTASARHYHTARTHIFDDRDDFTMGDATTATTTRPLKEVAVNAVSSSESASSNSVPVREEEELPPTKKPQSQGDKPRQQNQQQSQKDEEESRRQRERERSKRQAQELLAFSSKLTSLIDAPSTTTSNNHPTTTIPAAVAAEPTTTAGKDRRKRGILGRAASASSTTSGLLRQMVVSEDSAPGSSDSKARSVSVVDGEEEEEGMGGGEGHSTLTQVGYDDPGAAEARAQILGRMAGEKRESLGRGRRARSG